MKNNRAQSAELTDTIICFKLSVLLVRERSMNSEYVANKGPEKGGSKALVAVSLVGPGLCWAGD
jgi:hypothetical protein